MCSGTVCRPFGQERRACWYSVQLTTRQEKAYSNNDSTSPVAYISLSVTFACFSGDLKRISIIFSMPLGIYVYLFVSPLHHPLSTSSLSFSSSLFLPSPSFHCLPFFPSNLFLTSLRLLTTSLAFLRQPPSGSLPSVASLLSRCRADCTAYAYLPLHDLPHLSTQYASSLLL